MDVWWINHIHVNFKVILLKTKKVIKLLEFLGLSEGNDS